MTGPRALSVYPSHRRTVAPSHLSHPALFAPSHSSHPRTRSLIHFDGGGGRGRDDIENTNLMWDLLVSPGGAKGDHLLQGGHQRDDGRFVVRGGPGVEARFRGYVYSGWPSSCA